MDGARSFSLVGPHLALSPACTTHPAVLAEGIITSGFAVIVWFFVVTSPETAKFLNEEERAVAIQRLAAEQIGGKSASNITTGKDVRQGFANAFVRRPRSCARIRAC